MNGIVVEPVLSRLGVEDGGRPRARIEHRRPALIGDLPGRTLVDAVHALEEDPGLGEVLQQSEGVDDRLRIQERPGLVRSSSA